jgi:hypothetical protein
MTNRALAPRIPLQQMGLPVAHCHDVANSEKECEKVFK